MFENENIPFTREQLEKLQALPEGREGFQQMRDILTEKQNALVQSMFNR